MATQVEIGGFKIGPAIYVHLELERFSAAMMRGNRNITIQFPQNATYYDLDSGAKMISRETKNRVVQYGLKYYSFVPIFLQGGFIIPY